MKQSLAFILLLSLMMQVSSLNCRTGCANCLDFSDCSICSAGYTYVSQTASCRPCPDGCANCSYVGSGEISCDACLTEFTSDGNGSCFKCSPNCNTCAGFPENCTSCHHGQFPVNEDFDFGTFTFCEPDASCFASNCAQCSNISAQVCHQCMFGYYNFQGFCLSCAFPCGRCDYPFQNVYYQEVVPFIQYIKSQAYDISGGNYSDFNYSGYNFSDFNFSDFNFSDFNFSGFSRRLTADDIVYGPIDILTADLYNFTDKEIQDIILGKIMYDIIALRDTEGIPLHQIVLGVQVVINSFRGSGYISQNEIGQILYEKILEFDIDLSLDEALYLMQQQFHYWIYCQECQLGFYLFNYTCLPCDWECVNCDQNNCYQCWPGYSLSMDNQTCQQCHWPCFQCQNGDPSHCLSCEPPYQLNENGQCTKCNNPCQSCSDDPDYCYQCLHPYSWFANTGNCYICDDFDCLLCDQTDTSICYQCLDGLVANNGTCQLCPNNCQVCDVFDDPPTCYQCYEGYSVNGSGICVECQPGCKSCQFSSTAEGSICQECYDGLYANEQGKCRLCPSQCETCDQDQNCIDYEDGKLVFGDHVVDCWPGCKECSFEDPSVCRICQPRYYLDMDYCEPCQPGCQSCTSWDNCTTCGLGYVPVAGFCEECHHTCLECQPLDVNHCTQCRRGLNLENGTCISNCEKGCFQCQNTNSTNCFDCMEGYTLRNNGKCMKCLGSCTGYCDPKNITQCLWCTRGFQLKNNECVRCPAGCIDCFEGQCFDCLPGFYIDVNDDDQLYCKEQCKFPCWDCDDDTCNECEYGYKLSGGKCVPNLDCNPYCVFCPPGTTRDNSTNECVACSDENCAACYESQCFACFDGYYPNDADACVACSGNCEVCLDDQICIICDDGYLLEIAAQSGSDITYGTSCVACDDRCKTCIFEGDICTSCHDQFKLNGTTCLGKYVVRFEFVFDTDFVTFLEQSKSQQLVEAIVQLASFLTFEDIVWQTFAQGSVSATGVAGAANQAQANSANSAISSAASSGTLAGLTVTSSSTGVYYDDQEVQDSNNNNNNARSFFKNNAGLIAGVTVAAVVLIVVIIIVVYKCKAKSGQNAKVEDQSEIEIGNKDQTNSLGVTQTNNLNNKVMFS